VSGSPRSCTARLNRAASLAGSWMRTTAWLGVRGATSTCRRYENSLGTRIKTHGDLLVIALVPVLVLVVVLLAAGVTAPKPTLNQSYPSQELHKGESCSRFAAQQLACLRRATGF